MQRRKMVWCDYHMAEITLQRERYLQAGSKWLQQKADVGSPGPRFEAGRVTSEVWISAFNRGERCKRELGGMGDVDECINGSEAY